MSRSFAPSVLAVAALSAVAPSAAGAPPDDPGDEPASAPAEPTEGGAPASDGPPTPGGDDDGPDAFSWQVNADTHVRLFQRALLPGPGGSVVEVATAAPFYQYARLRIDDLDVPWRKDSIDVELSAWGEAELGEIATERRGDGDVSVALVRHRFGVGDVTLGRQIVTGGAARFTRLDGVSVGATAPFGLGLDAYGGFRVLPRWTGAQGYQLLGSVADTLATHPEALAEPSREQYWLAGARAHYSYLRWISLGASFHEEHGGGGLARRDFGVDLRSDPLDELSIRGALLLDLDAVVPSEARLSVDAYPVRDLVVSASYGHAVPGSLISHESVFSVFSTDAYDEGGIEASYKPIPILTLGADGWIQGFVDGALGARGGATARISDDGISVTFGYRRVFEDSLDGSGFLGPAGYHGGRVAVGVEPLEHLRFTTEAHAYFYDTALGGRRSPSAPRGGEYGAGVSSSWMGTLTGRYEFVEPVALLLGGSVARTPYAEVDAQALLRLELGFHGGER